MRKNFVLLLVLFSCAGDPLRTSVQFFLDDLRSALSRNDRDAMYLYAPHLQKLEPTLLESTKKNLERILAFPYEVEVIDDLHTKVTFRAEYTFVFPLDRETLQAPWKLSGPIQTLTFIDIIERKRE